jgi:hypothetical protein
VWRSPVPRYPWIQPANSTHPGGGARTNSKYLGRRNFGELIRNAGTSSRCNFSSDAGPEVSPSLDAPAYSYPRVIHGSEETASESFAAASVNNSAAKKVLAMKSNQIFPCGENTHRPATNSLARRSTPKGSPSSQATRWSPTNTQWRTAWISRSHYKPFAGISQRVF